ncbi:two-component system protein A [Massariosphaeria phaeospora]|uniref:Two-component system protein A n=1 Tax=Massariosphaeria phaeospora TaxID=100035 RepID=A0A7C8MAM6_9PLEO|nr:two-component system protein A [Massariosphaeria phaeospora]
MRETTASGAPLHPPPPVDSVHGHSASSLVDLPSLPPADDSTLDLFRYTPIPTILLRIVELDALPVICQVSESLEAVSGACRREQLLGRTVDAFFDDNVNLPSVASAHNAIRVALDSKRPFQLEVVLADGRTAWSIRAVPIGRHGSPQYIQMELQNTTEERHRQLQLEERLYANETYRMLVETVKDYAIFMLDPKGLVATWNAGAQVFKGYTKDEIIGKHFSNFYGDEDRANDKPGRELRDALRDGRCEDEGWRYRKDGSRFWANVVITPVYREGTLLGFSKVTRDLSERKAAESQLIDAYEEASKLKSEFLANMSHEIRTPMHGMLSALTLLLDTRLNPEQLELARVIEESGEVLLQVINDILDYSKLATGSFSISHDIISVAEIIQSVFRAHQKVCKSGLTLETNLDPHLPQAAEGDSLRYRQIMQNFMSNAMKFTESGYVRVNATLKEEDDEFYTILTEVVDTGIGLPAGAASSLFTPFTQFEMNSTKRYKGTGLGLSICKSLAELMGGNIGYHPNPEGHGSTFWFTARLKKVNQLRIADALQEKLESLSAPSVTASPFEDIKLAATNTRILLAEDNLINQKVMLKMLAGLGFANIDRAIDGREAVTLATKHPPPYDAILMDINMPMLDGVAATREIRSLGVHTPIIAMTANALKGQAESYIAKGMTAYVAKPVDRKLLIKVLLKCLRGKTESPS